MSEWKIDTVKGVRKKSGCSEKIEKGKGISEQREEG